jgi:hypothetical protein
MGPMNEAPDCQGQACPVLVLQEWRIDAGHFLKSA